MSTEPTPTLVSTRPSARRALLLGLRLALVLIGIILIWQGFKKPLLSMPIMGDVFFHETAEGGEKKKQIILGLVAAGGIAGILRARYLSGLLAGAGTVVFLASLEAIHRVGMDRIETMRQNRYMQNMADELAKGIKTGNGLWIVATGCALVIIAGFLPGSLWGKPTDRDKLLAL